MFTITKQSTLSVQHTPEDRCCTTHVLMTIEQAMAHLCVLAVVSLAVQTVTGRTVLVLYSSRIASQEDISFNLVSSLDNFNLVFRDLNTSSCKREEAKAVSVIIEEVFVNMRSKGNSIVTTIIGPSCTDSAYAISRLANRSEISMTHLHTSPMPAALASQLPNSFGLLGPVELLADASIELIQHANWSQVIALYQDTDTEMNFMFHYLREQLSQGNMSKILLSILFDGHIPLKFALSHVPIRIIFLLADRDLAWKVLCEAFHLGIVYPHYQWVIFRTALDDILAKNVVYSENGDLCHREDMMVVLEKAILLGYENFSSGDSKTESSALYDNTLALLFEGVGFSQTHNMTLNGALSQLEMKTEKYVFVGQILNSTSCSKAYSNSRRDPFSWTRYDGSKFEFTPSNFTTFSEKVNIIVFCFTQTFFSIQILATALMQALTIHYRKTKAIKATSPNIQQVAYFGIYLLIASNVIYTSQNALQIEDKVYSHLCIADSLLSRVGGVLLLGSLCVKAWRLYRIFNHYMNPGDLLSDRFLILIILALAAVNLVISTSWIVVDTPVKAKGFSKIDFQKRSEIVQDVCRPKVQLVWLVSFTVYEQILLITAAILSIMVKSTAPKSQKHFKRNEVIMLTYLVTALQIIGIPTFILLRETGNLLLRYITYVALYSCYTTLYMVFFFAAPLLRAVREGKNQIIPEM